MNLITTSEAAKELGISRNRVLALIAAGRLPATKFGMQFQIQRRHLRLVRNRKPGRPRKGGK